MIKYVYLLLSCLLLVCGNVWGQEYNRSSVSRILLDYKDKLQEPVYRAFSALPLSDRYDENKIQTVLLVYEGNRQNFEEDGLSGKEKRKTPDRTALLTDYLNRENVGLQVIASIFNRRSDGTMNMEIVNARAAYNKTDEEYEVLQATAKNASGLREGGEALIKNSYIMVYDYANLRTENYKGLFDTEEDVYWRATPSVYVFRVDFTDELRNRFYAECWIDEETEATERPERLKAFDEFRVPVEFVMKYNTTQDVATKIADFRKKSKSERGDVTEEDLKTATLPDLVSNAYEYLNEQVERKHTAFQVKTAVADVKPVRAKIGLKEGVKTDRRFFLYEYDVNEKQHLRGVIRATNRITDNRKVTDGNTAPTEFYQIAGKAAQPGWDMVEKKDLGINAEIGYQVGNLNGIAVNLSTSFYGRKNFNHYILLNFLWGLDKYEIDWYGSYSNTYLKTVNYNIFAVNLGYGYGFMKRNWELYPYIGAGAQMLMSDEKSDDSSSEEEDSKFMDETAWMFNAGVRGVINIWYPVQAFGSLEFSTALSKGKVYDAIRVDKDLDKASSGVHFSFGLRYCF